MNTPNTFREAVEQIYNNLTYKQRDDGTPFYTLENDIDWQKDIIFRSHLDRLPDDDIYDRIHTIIYALYEQEAENSDDAFDIINTIECDIYISDLLTWFSSNNSNLEYLTEVLEESQTTDGFLAIAQAQSKYIYEIGSSLISAINDTIN